MPKKQVTVEFSPDSNVAANTSVEIARDILPDKMDVRGDHDPVVHAVLKQGASDTSTAGTTVLATTTLTSDGQVSGAGAPAAGEIGVIDGAHVALGNALNSYDYLYLTVEVRGGTNIKN